MQVDLNQFRRQQHLVVGDLYLDHYVFGAPQRVSREAPVLVLDEERRENRLGGGAAPALALKALGCEVAIVGVVGDDEAGASVIALLEDAGIDASHVAVDPARPTTVKTRVVAEGFFLFPQQLVRLDLQDRNPVPDGVQDAIHRSIDALGHGSIVVSDYRSGVVTDRTIRRILETTGRNGGRAVVDSQGDLQRFTGFDLIKCNKAEVEALLDVSLGNRPDRKRRLTQLRGELACGCLVVTRGEEGASVVLPGGYAEVPASNRSEVYDVTGAGDTVVAVMAAGLEAGLDPTESARLAQVAAGIVVRKWGNAQATLDELTSRYS